MGALIGALRVSLSAETAAFEAGMKRAQRTTSTAASGIKASLGGLKGIIAGFTGALALGGLTAAIKSSLEYASHLTELGETLGLTAKDLQTFSFAAGQVGISQEELEQGIQKLTISMGKAQVGSQAQIKAFNAIGISIDQLKGKDTGEVFRMIADKLQTVSDRSKRAAIEVALFGKAGAKLDNLLSGAEGRLSDLSDAAEKLGIVLSDEQIKHADETADKLAALQTVLKANIAGAVADNADAILGLANALATLVRWTGQAIQGWKSMIAEFNSKEGKIGSLIGNAYHGGPNPWAKASGNADTWSKIMGGNDAFLRQGRSLVGGGGGDVGNFLAGGGGGHKAAKAAADHSAEDALRREHDFQQEVSRANIDILDAKKDQAADYIEQTTIAIQIKDAEMAAFEMEQEYQRQLFKLTKGKQGESDAHLATLAAANKSKDALERKAILDEETAHREKDTQELIQSDFDRRRNILEAQSSIATTAKDRRKIELDLLELAYEQKRQALQDIIDHSKDEKAKEDARRDLINLKATHAADKQNVLNQTRNPFEEWAAGAKTASDDIIESLQAIEVKGLDGLTEALTNVLMGTENLKDAFHQVAASILADLLQMTIKMLIFKAITSAFGGQTGSVPGFSSGGSINVGKVPGFATGGSITVGGRGGTDKNMLSLNGLPIARVSYGERINIANDDTPMGGPSVSLTMHNDFRGADPSSVARLENHLDQLERRLPGQIVSTMKDASDRFVWRGK